MKLFRSPVFYFGILLAVCVAAALAAPFIVDWNQYRADLQTWGEKLTGRQIAIRGDVNVRLFPFPSLTADDVAIANPENFKEPVFASIERVTVQITLGGLINGDLQVEAIDLARPTVTLLRSGDERLNWLFEPAGSVRNSPLLAHVLLDKINVTDGSIVYVDDVRHIKSDVHDIFATLSAPSLVGPWRSAGRFIHGDVSREFTVGVAAWESDKPLAWSARVSPSDKAGYSVQLDGDFSEPEGLKGHVRVEPVLDAEGKGDSEGKLRKVAFTAEFAANFQRASLTKIEVRPVDTTDQATLITGSAEFAMGDVISAKVDLSAPRVDLDVLAGAQSKKLLRAGGGLALLDSYLRALPADMEITGKAKALLLKAGGENLENAELQISANRQELRVSRVAASLPGRSRFLFQGVFYPGERAAELGGELSIETFDARSLASWLFAEARGEIAHIWTGNRGHLKLESQVRLTSSKLALSAINYELNGQSGRGELSLLVNGERPILSVNLEAQRIDLDDFLSPDQRSFGLGSFAWLLSNFAEEQSKRDLSLTVDVGQLVLNGVTSNKLTTSIETNIRGFDLKNFEILEAEGTKFSASGLILRTETGADGDLEANIEATHPEKLLTLFGLVPNGRRPAWLATLGKTKVAFKMSARAGDKNDAIELSLSGTSGAFAVSGTGSLGIAQASDPTFAGSLKLESDRSRSFQQLLDARDVPDDSIPGTAALSLDGRLKGEMNTKLDLDIYGTTLNYVGESRLSEMQTKGRFLVLSKDASTLLKALKAPIMEREPPSTLPVELGGQIIASSDATELADVSGTFAGGKIAGSLKGQSGGKWKGDVNVDKLSLIDALAFGFLPWSGAANTERLFASPGSIEPHGEFWIHAQNLDVFDGLSVPIGEVAINMSAETRQFVAYGKTTDGQTLSIDISADTSIKPASFKGRLAMPFELSKLFKMTDQSRPFDGLATVDMTFDAQGLSPASALAAINASGSFSLVNVILHGISPGKFSSVVKAEKDPAKLQGVLAELRTGPGIAMRPTFGSVAIKNGTAKVTPFSFDTPDAAVSLDIGADLASADFRIAVQLAFNALPNLPPMTVAYFGQPYALERRDEAGDLAAFLGFKLLNQSVDDLEKLQQEQDRLAKEEQQQRAEDIKKLALYTAQRTELRLRQRELRIWKGERAKEQEIQRRLLEKIVSGAEVLTGLEVQRRAVESAVHGAAIPSE